MKRIFSNTVTKRLISAFLVLAMIVTIIPVTDAEARKKTKEKYLYSHGFYTVDGTQTKGHRDEVIDIENGTGLHDCGSALYHYSLNADEVKRLIAGEELTVHFDRFRTIFIESRSTNTRINELFVTMSYTDKKGRKRNLECISVDCATGNSEDFNDGINDQAEKEFNARGVSCGENGLGQGPLVTDATVTFRLMSRELYLKHTRFELPKGDKGKKKRTYRFFFWTGNCIPLTVDGKKQKLYGSEELCARNSTYVSFGGLEEPYEIYRKDGKEPFLACNLGREPQYQLGLNAPLKVLRKPEDVVIRGVYTHREVKCRVIYTDKRETGHLVYDKFRHKSKLAYSEFDARETGDPDSIR